MSISLTIDRQGLATGGLPIEDLVLADDCGTGNGLWLGDGIIRPTFQPRKTYAPDSKYVRGKQLIAVVRDQGELSFPVIVKGDSPATVEARVNELEQALWQFTYDVTLSVDGQSTTFEAEPAVPVWGRIFLGQLRTFSRAGQVSIAINPA